jgi:anti-sigma regulatory factor (Ser/Thr protein kinase)
MRDVLCASSVVELLGEACANAAIHGGATQVNASLQLQAQRLLKVEVTNNGPRMHELKSTGLGGQILDEITLEWGLEFGPTGARLTAVMPLA